MEKCAENTFPGIASSTALWLIAIYQRWISPRKGFRCAHSVLHGGPGCSGFAKQAIREHGLWQAVAHIRQRFRDCRTSMHTLLSQQAEPPEDELTEADLETARRQRKKNKREGWCTWNDCALASCEAPGACCSGAGSKGAAAGGALGAGAEASTGICGASAGAVGEGIAGACGGIAGGISCCG